MTDRPDISPDAPDPQVRAAEYALGLLSPAERAAFEAQLRAEPALAGEVVSWQTYFADMAEAEVAPIVPPARVQRAIEAAVFGTDADASVSTQAISVSLWNRLAFWRGLSLATTALAAVAVGIAILPDVQPPAPVGEPEVAPEGIPPGTLLMTHLIPTEGSTLGLAVTREPSGVLHVRRVAGDSADGRAHELWVIAGDDAPVSLGVLGADPLTTITPSAQAAELFSTGAALAISDEPEGGSPTGAPTGDILAVGTLIAL